MKPGWMSKAVMLTLGGGGWKAKVHNDEGRGTSKVQTKISLEGLCWLLNG